MRERQMEGRTDRRTDGRRARENEDSDGGGSKDRNRTDERGEKGPRSENEGDFAAVLLRMTIRNVARSRSALKDD